MTKTQVKQKKNDIEISAQFKKALDLLEKTDKNVFITGRAGTGKSTLLDHFRKNTKKRVAVLAPTGVAALNVGGQTIHSFFRFRPDIVLKKVKKLTEKANKKSIYSKLDIIIIDEISMVRSDLLDCIDKFMCLNGKERYQPFGGTQMVFIGDLYQLSPVVTSKERDLFKSDYSSQYFFDANVFSDFKMEFVELEKIYRQQDKNFIGLLNKIRNNSVLEDDLEILNQRCIGSTAEHKKDDFYIYLTTTNKMADEINKSELIESPSELYISKGCVEGNFESKYLPTQERLELKVGSQVMFMNNDSAQRWVNGTIGNIVAIDSKDKNIDAYDDPSAVIVVELSDGKTVDVVPFSWSIYHYVYNSEIGALDTKKVGSFTQFPIKLAWAVTIHKSQGKTFDKVIIDIGHGTFSHGQVYVALSRCTSLEGIILKKPIAKKHIWMDRKVSDFLTNYQYQIAESNCSADEKIAIIKKAIDDKAGLDMVYLKANDTKSRRRISPISIDQMEFKGRKFLGLRALCHIRQEERTFRVDRILEIK